MAKKIHLITEFKRVIRNSNKKSTKLSLKERAFFARFARQGGYKDIDSMFARWKKLAGLL